MQSRARRVLTNQHRGGRRRGTEGRGGLLRGAGPAQSSQHPREGRGQLSTGSFPLTQEGHGVGVLEHDPRETPHTPDGRRRPQPYAPRPSGKPGLAPAQEHRALQTPLSSRPCPSASPRQGTSSLHRAQAPRLPLKQRLC